jgi:hypothetical protein
MMYNFEVKIGFGFRLQIVRGLIPNDVKWVTDPDLDPDPTPEPAPDPGIFVSDL